MVELCYNIRKEFKIHFCLSRDIEVPWTMNLTLRMNTNHISLARDISIGGVLYNPNRDILGRGIGHYRKEGMNYLDLLSGYIDGFSGEDTILSKISIEFLPPVTIGDLKTLKAGGVNFVLTLCDQPAFKFNMDGDIDNG